MSEPFDPIPLLAGLLASAQRLALGNDNAEAVGEYASRLTERLPVPAYVSSEEAEAAIRKAVRSGSLADVLTAGLLEARAERGYDPPPLVTQYATIGEFTRAHEDRVYRLQLERPRVGQLDLEQALRHASPEQVQLALSTVWEPEQYVSLREMLQAEQGEDPRA